MVPVRERVSGANHPDTLAARDDLARWAMEANRLAGKWEAVQIDSLADYAECVPRFVLRSKAMQVRGIM
jgi:hypothetical protein